MGLDMYLKAKTKLLDGESEKMTGACGGLFPMAPVKQSGVHEIGYWRKAYAVRDEIMEYCDTDGENNCVDNPLSKIFCKAILEHAKEVLAYGSYKDEWEKQDWEDTVTFFTRALDIYEKDPDAEIYFYQWY